MVAVTQIRNPGTEGRMYFGRKVAEGKTKKAVSYTHLVGVVLATQTNHPNSETGRAVFQCAAGRVRSTTFCNATGLQVRPNLPALPKLFRTSNQAVDP